MQWSAEKALLCPRGHPTDESMALDADYNADAMRCKACEAMDAKSRAISEDRNASTAGLYISVRKNGVN